MMEKTVATLKTTTSKKSHDGNSSEVIHKYQKVTKKKRRVGNSCVAVYKYRKVRGEMILEEEPTTPTLPEDTEPIISTGNEEPTKVLSVEHFAAGLAKSFAQESVDNQSSNNDLGSKLE